MSHTSLRILPRPPGFVPWDAAGALDTIPARFEHFARLHPDRLALTGASGGYTFDALNRAANRLAHAIFRILSLQELSAAPPSGQAGLLLDHDAPQIVALLALLKAGLAYVPLDPSAPAARLAEILADAQISLLVTDAAHARQAAGLLPPGARLLLIDDLPGGLPETDLDLPLSGDTLLNIVYTSGSTGQPKGVMQTHANILTNMRDISDQLAYSPSDRWALVIPLTFGASISNVCGSLLNGGALCMYDVKTAGLAGLGAWLAQQRITVYHSVPTIYRHFLNLADPGLILPDVRLVMLGGEPLLRSDLELFRRHFGPGAFLRNSLGSTEAYAVTTYLMARDAEFPGPVAPLGYVIGERRLSILDEQNRPLPPGQVGQVAVTSRYLSPGYWRRPDLTTAAYLPDPAGGRERTYLTGDLGSLDAGGLLEYHGRQDSMVKINGLRVEPAEIEAALHAIPEVRDAVVAARPAPDGRQRLVAYLMGGANPLPSPDELRQALSLSLPAGLIPAVFMTLPAFPLLPFGKVNRRALPDPDWNLAAATRPYAPPRTFIEQRMVDLFIQALGLGSAPQPGVPTDPIGIDDNFFELHGDSLRAGQLLTQLRSTFHCELSLQDIYTHPTPASLAELLTAQGITSAPAPDAGDADSLARKLRLLGDV